MPLPLRPVRLDALFHQLHGQGGGSQVAPSVRVVGLMGESGVRRGLFGALDVAEGDVR